MTNVVVNLDVGIWLNSKGQVQLFVGEDPIAAEMIPLIDLVRMEIDSHKIPSTDYLDFEDARKLNKLKKALLQCTALLTKELVNAK